MTNLRLHLRRHRADGRGQSLVEFAVVFPLIALLAFAFIDIGRAVFTVNTLANAAREASRVAAVNQLDPASAPWNCNANRPVESVTSPNWTFRGCAMTAGATIGVGPADVSVSYARPPGTSLSCSPTRNVGCIVTVTVVTTFDPITPVAGTLIGSLSLTASSQMPIERTFP